MAKECKRCQLSIYDSREKKVNWRSAIQERNELEHNMFKGAMDWKLCIKNGRERSKCSMNENMLAVKECHKDSVCLWKIDKALWLSHTYCSIQSLTWWWRMWHRTNLFTTMDHFASSMALQDNLLLAGIGINIIQTCSLGFEAKRLHAKS
jgi:hypothetical protein